MSGAGVKSGSIPRPLWVSRGPTGRVRPDTGRGALPMPSTDTASLFYSIHPQAGLRNHAGQKASRLPPVHGAMVPQGVKTQSNRG